MKFLSYILILMFINPAFSNAETNVKVLQTNGEAKVRYGLDEDWQSVMKGINLKDIDTILTGENGEIVLEIGSGKKFILGNNSILDIGDLREIQEKELFLFLMSKKVEKMEPRNEKTKLRVGNISSVHGEDKSKSDSSNFEYNQNLIAEKEINGAIALFIQKYYTNTLYKMHNLIDKYKSGIETGKLHFFIAKSFEALNKKGQAIDSYQFVIDTYKNKKSLSDSEKKYVSESEYSLKILKSNP